MTLFYIDPKACRAALPAGYQVVLMPSMTLAFLVGAALDFVFMGSADPTAGVPGQPVSAFLPFFLFPPIFLLMAFSLVFARPRLGRSLETGFVGYGAAVVTGLGMGFAIALVPAAFGLLLVAPEAVQADARLVLAGAIHGAVVYGMPSAVLVWARLQTTFPEISATMLGERWYLRPLMTLLPFGLIPFWQMFFWPYFMTV
ncbi:hypothetical protein [Thetidibacter halocola]|uniref:Uncharacterized protein n=1 Tax=Thetidibacter halocola TaxID=2827239 RepID=A0A8J7WBN2_9RHOB|nr:hypothetical protein [Thetidibacter halocola]MBS0124565.1 hypothetical protein [Thetidibacter halocola]